MEQHKRMLYEEDRRKNPDAYDANGVPFFNKRNKAEEAPIHEEYGEIDRPLPLSDINEIKDKFVEWDMYKMIVMKNLISTQKKMIHWCMTIDIDICHP